MLPVSQLLNEFFGDSTLVQQQPEDLLLEKLFELVPVECRCARELIFALKTTIRNENMKMRGPFQCAAAKNQTFWQNARRKPGRIPQRSLRHNDTSPMPSDFAVDRQPAIGTTRFPMRVLDPSSDVGKRAHRAVAPGITGAPMAFQELICYVF